MFKQEAMARETSRRVRNVTTLLTICSYVYVHFYTWHFVRLCWEAWLPCYQYFTVWISILAGWDVIHNTAMQYFFISIFYLHCFSVWKLTWPWARTKLLSSAPFLKVISCSIHSTDQSRRVQMGEPGPFALQLQLPLTSQTTEGVEIITCSFKYIFKTDMILQNANLKPDSFVQSLLFFWNCATRLRTCSEAVMTLLCK